MPRYRQPMPPEFPQYADKEGNLRLRKRFGVGGITIEIWRRQIGARYQPIIKAAKVRAVVTKRPKRFVAYEHERIEDLDDFGENDIARSLDLRSFELDW